MKKPYGWTIWLTGRPASGKTTLARALRRKLNQQGISAVLLDSDEVRRVVAASAAYAPEERDWFYNRLVEIAAWLVNSGENVIIAATGSRHSYREAARARLAPRYAEVWVRCPVAVCRARDPKGLYAQAAAGAIANLPGCDAAYDPPTAPAVVIDTDRQTPKQAVETIIDHLPFLQREAAACA